MRKLFLFFAFFISFLFFTSLKVQKAMAVINLCGPGLISCESVCPFSYTCTEERPDACNNGPTNMDSNGCGTPCEKGEAWSKYEPVCLLVSLPDDPIQCEYRWKWAGDVCSTGDKCVAGEVGLRYGNCVCGGHSANIYKTCCNGNTPVACRNYGVQDNFPPPEGVCTPYRTVSCGLYGQPACGAAACQTSSPTATTAPGATGVPTGVVTGVPTGITTGIPTPIPGCNHHCPAGQSEFCTNLAQCNVAGGSFLTESEAACCSVANDHFCCTNPPPPTEGPSGYVRLVCPSAVNVGEIATLTIEHKTCKQNLDNGDGDDGCFWQNFPVNAIIGPRTGQVAISNCTGFRTPVDQCFSRWRHSVDDRWDTSGWPAGDYKLSVYWGGNTDYGCTHGWKDGRFTSCSDPGQTTTCNITLNAPKSCQVGISVNGIVPTINPNNSTYTLTNGSNVTFSATTTGGNGNLWLEKTNVVGSKRYTTNNLGTLMGIAPAPYVSTDYYGQSVTSTYYLLDEVASLSKNLNPLALPIGTDYAVHCDMLTGSNKCSGNPLCYGYAWGGTLACATGGINRCTTDQGLRPDFLFFHVAQPTATPTCAPPSRPQCNNSEGISGSDVTLRWTAPGSWGGPACIASKLFRVYTSSVSPGSNYPLTFTIRPGVDSEISDSPFNEMTFTTTLTNQAIGDHFWFLSASNSLASAWSENICSYNISADVDWWQTKDGDVHAQNNITSNIPGTATYPFLSLDGDGGNPGVISYNGDRDINDQELSSTNWQAKTSFASGLLLNYNFFQNKLGIGATAFSTWPPASSGTYRHSSGTLVLDGAVDLNNNEKIIILADGDVKINNDIIVREGSFLAIISGGSINFDKQVERAQGFYLANRQIIVEGTNNGVDRQFLGQGSFVALTGFLFQRRIAPGQSRNVASEYFQPRPDLYINAPLNFLLSTHSDFEELAP